MRNALRWLESHRDWCMDILRIYLGVGLIAKAVSFIAARDELAALILDNDMLFFGGGLVHWVILTHILGGLLMTIGLGTRVGALIQIPTLLGATFFVHGASSLVSLGEETRFSALVLVLLLLFVWHGSGPLSVKAWLRSADPTAGDAR